MARPNILVLQHVACENLGTIEDALGRADLTHTYVRIDQGEPVPKLIGDSGGLIVMGGPMSVCESDKIAHLKDEMKLIDSFMAAQLPVLGVCLGSQMLAQCLGGKVYPGKRKEIGWFDVFLAPTASDDEAWSTLPEHFAGFHWHGDVFDLPRSAVRLARSELTATQAFRYGTSVYGILFHMEVTQPQVQKMTTMFADEIRAAGTTAERILTDTTANLPRLKEIGVGIYDAWARLVEG